MFYQVLFTEGDSKIAYRAGIFPVDTLFHYQIIFKLLNVMTCIVRFYIVNYSHLENFIRQFFFLIMLISMFTVAFCSVSIVCLY